ncbi:MAG: prolipoprotein diacylglyceryl transferase [Desulfococcaceae bacterium]|jgi:phosphatidylglycerol:prolipoprotein diacylglycerol transferase|nr:prolipoprotein diacylglyceryl transferase [Desulfococcaceae bacterium]
MNAFRHWWQHLPEKISPVIFEIGSFKLQYYGLMYLVAFGISYALVLYRIRHEKQFGISAEQAESLTTAMILGVILGGRAGYVLFYNFSYYLRHPLEIFLPFSFSGGITFTGISGMSYHGGLMGVILAAWIYARRNRLHFWEIADLYAPVVPLGYTFGRIGNFINGELFGRVTDAPFGMYFPLAPGPKPRHPSQLYEAFFEGLFLFAVLWMLRKHASPRGAMLGFYLMGYGTVRFFIEYFREPDAHLGFVFLSFSTGQILCFLMILSGAALYFYVWQKNRKQGACVS